MKLTENQRDNLTMIVEFVGGSILFVLIMLYDLSNLDFNTFRISFVGIFALGIFLKIKLWKNY